MTTFRADAPQYRIDVDRVKAQTLHVNVDQVFSTIQTFMGSTYVVQFNKFGRTFQAYVQADAQFRLRPEDITQPDGAQQPGPDGADRHAGDDRADHRPAADQPLQSLSDRDRHRHSGAGRLVRPGDGADGADGRAHPCRPAPAIEWTALSYQEKLVGNQMYLVFGLGMLLVYLVLAGQYESWYAPLSIVLSVPLALVGPASVLLGAQGRRQSLCADRPDPADRALGQERDPDRRSRARAARCKEGHSIVEAAVEAARARFRPILMTSIAFILSVVPLVIATGAGASARKSIGITVFTGMIASTCLAVLFVPSLFVVIQRFEEWLKARRKPKVEPAPEPT